MPPAATLVSPHICPMFNVLVPHIGGMPSPPGNPTVLICGQPAICAGDPLICPGPPNVVAMGSLGVMICGKPAARMFDPTAHGGIILMGMPTVMIGEIGMSMGQLIALLEAILAGILDVAFQWCEGVTGALSGGVQPPASPAATGAAAGGTVGPFQPAPLQHHWFKAKVTLQNGDPAQAFAYELKASDGTVRKGFTRPDGMAVEANLPAGSCEFKLTDLDKDSWNVES